MVKAEARSPPVSDTEAGYDYLHVKNALKPSPIPCCGEGAEFLSCSNYLTSVLFSPKPEYVYIYLSLLWNILVYL